MGPMMGEQKRKGHPSRGGSSQKKRRDLDSQERMHTTYSKAQTCRRDVQCVHGRRSGKVGLSYISRQASKPPGEYFPLGQAMQRSLTSNDGDVPGAHLPIFSEAVSESLCSGEARAPDGA